MDKAKRRKRFQQKKRNHDKWEHRVKQRKHKEKVDPILYDEDLKEVGILANHGKLCSCDNCGNPRHNNFVSKKERRTIQERRYDE